MLKGNESWVYIADVDDIPKGGKKCVTVMDISILLCRVYTDIFAVRNHCPHLGKSMEGGRLQEYELICPHHNACFDIRDGNPVSGPSVFPLTIYPTRVVEEKIYIQYSV